jgi:hypothetical protein
MQSSQGTSSTLKERASRQGAPCLARDTNSFLMMAVTLVVPTYFLTKG